MTYHSDYQDYLFSRSEVAALLESAGYPLKSLANSVNEEGDFTQQWMRIYAAKSALRVHEAAWIINGKEPPDSYPRSSVSDPSIRHALRSILDSANLGDIEVRQTDWHIDDEPQTWLLDHQSIIGWCSSVGYEWPLSQFMQPVQAESKSASAPERRDNQKNQSGIEQELSALRQEVAELRATVEELRKSVPLHPSGLMGLAIQVQHEYWQEPSIKRPKAEVIIQEISSKNPDISNAEARAVEKVACPIDRKKR